LIAPTIDISPQKGSTDYSAMQAKCNTNKTKD